MTAELIVAAPETRAGRLRLAVAAWLEEHRAVPRTHRLYAAELASFTAALDEAGLALDDEPGLIAAAAQAWAGTPRARPDGRRAASRVPAATANKRLAALSSFYRSAIQHGFLSPPNPLELVRRRRAQPFRAARPLPISHVRAALAAIDRTELVGRRDHTLLTVALTTGRRLAELAGLRWGHLGPLDDGRVTITWAHCKGGKVLYDTLPPALGRALLTYLYALYGARLGALEPAAPVWVSLSNHRRGGPLSPDAIADICERRLGTSKVHSLRHTFAHQMEQSGAQLTTIQQRLGHSSVATTAVYLQALRSDENPHADALLEALGVGDDAM